MSGFSLSVVGVSTPVAWPADLDTGAYRVITVDVSKSDTGAQLARSVAVVGNY